MKTFFIITAACSVMLAGIAFNSRYVRKFADDAQAQLNRIDLGDENCEEQISSLTAFTENHLKRVEFAIPHTKSALINDYLALLRMHAANGERSEFEKTRILLTNLLKEIGELEKAALFNIL